MTTTIIPKRVLLHRTVAAKHARRSHFDYPTILVQTTPHFSVFYDPATGASGRAAAQHVAAAAEADYAKLLDLFGLDATLAPQHFNVIVAPLSSAMNGSGGAYHTSCKSADLYCDVDTERVELTLALMAAEAVEVFEATQGGGWDCGASNGEGLSRYLAEVLHPGLLDGYASSEFWVQAGKPDWVTQTEPTDQDGASFGCAVLFLFWLQQLGYAPAAISRAASPTLAGTYRILTGKETAFNDFTAAVNALPAPPTQDNPWDPTAPSGSVGQPEPGHSPSKTPHKKH